MIPGSTHAEEMSMHQDLARRLVAKATRMPPELERRNRRPPAWWTAARLGIFVHWTIASVPAFAPRGRGAQELAAERHPLPNAEVPYVEWYPNSIKFPHSSAGEHHRAVYGEAPYEDFRAVFEAGLERWDPASWAAAFAATGAGYVVFVAKHHDGYCLWPTEVPNLHAPGWHSERDIVGELAEAVRAAGMKFGLYYSGGYDFTFDPHPIGTYTDGLRAVPFGDYPAYAAAQVRELVDRYQPSVLWNDICWPAPRSEIYKIFEYYFDVVPDGCINDRWLPMRDLKRFLRLPGVDRAVNELLRRGIAKNGLIPPRVAFSQHRTPEFADLPQGFEGPWEMTRGMDQSFGYNKFSTEADYLDQPDLLDSLTKTMRAGGNFLINVGPRGEDAQIPGEQLTRLQWIADQNAITLWTEV
jgi:alpha-L-fucosidase